MYGAIHEKYMMQCLDFELTHLWIEKDLIYTSVRQVFGFDLVAVAKVSLAGGN